MAHVCRSNVWRHAGASEPSEPANRTRCDGIDENWTDADAWRCTLAVSRFIDRGNHLRTGQDSPGSGAWSALAVRQDRGPRWYMADATRTVRNLDTGRVAWALADGIGDDWPATEAATMAVEAAARAAGRGGSAYAIAEARKTLRAWYGGAPRGQSGDCVMVVATGMDAIVGGGLDIAWAGDCRAYLLRHGDLQQLTTDHTLGTKYRASAQQWIRRIAPSKDHIVTSSVHTESPIDTVRVVGTEPGDRLLLCSDGVHRSLDPGSIASTLRTAPSSTCAADGLMRAVRGRARDNAILLIAGAY